MRTLSFFGPVLQFLALVLVFAVVSSDRALAQQSPLTREALVAVAEGAPGPVKGSEQAPVTIVEFSDFQCTYCRKFWRETLPKLEAEYINAGKVRFIYRNFVALGPLSEQAAEAAACAREQGKFWAYHDALFERHGRLPDAATMEQLRLDPAVLAACTESGRHKERILAESAMARRLGASGTPAFLINGKLLIGAHPFETFKQILETLGKELSVPASVDPGATSRS